jgi:hypothetical protein
MSNISFDMKANDENVQKTLVKQQAEIAKLVTQLAAMEQQSKKNADASRAVAAAQAEQRKEAEKLREASKAQAEAAKETAKAEAEAAKAAAKAQAEAADAAAEAERRHQKVMAEGKRVTDSVATATERYEAEVKRLNQLRKEGAITAETHARAIAKENAGMSSGAASASTFGTKVESAAGSLAQFATGMLSATALVSTIREEYDRLIERQGKSASANIGLAGEQEALLANLSGADAASVFKGIRTISADSNIKEADITRAVNESMAAKADMSVGDVMAAVSAATKIRKFAPQELAGLSGAIIDTQKQTGLGTDQALGFQLQMQSQARVKDLKSLAANFTPSVGGIMQLGADRGTAAAILSSLSHGMGDTTGAASGTAGIQLAKQLREFGGEGSDIGETLKTIQGSEAVRTEFLKDASFEAKALPAVESLLSGGTQAKQFDAAKIAFQANPLEALQAAIAARGASQAIGIAEQDLGAANAVDQFTLKGTAGAQSGVARARLREMQDQTGRMGIVAGAENIARDVLTGGQVSQADALFAMRVELAKRQQGMTDFTQAAGGLAPGLGQYLQMRNLQSPENQQTIESLKEMIAAMERQTAALEQQNNLAAGKNNAGAMAGRAAAQKELVP